MRAAIAALLVVLLGVLPACKREVPSEAKREAEYVQLEAAAAADPATVVGAWLSQEVGGVWRADAARMPKMAAALPRVRADVYADEGWVNVAFAGLAREADAWTDGELGLLLESIAARDDVAGASVLLRDDADGTTSRVLAIAGHDAAEAAMALVDAWAPELELDYAPDGDESGAPARSSLVAALRASDATGRRLGGKLEKKGSVVVIRFPADAKTREVAAALAEDHLTAALAAPRDLVIGSAGQ